MVLCVNLRCCDRIAVGVSLDTSRGLTFKVLKSYLIPQPPLHPLSTSRSLARARSRHELWDLQAPFQMASAVATHTTPAEALEIVRTAEVWCSPHYFAGVASSLSRSTLRLWDGAQERSCVEHVGHELNVPKVLGMQIEILHVF